MEALSADLHKLAAAGVWSGGGGGGGGGGGDGGGGGGGGAGGGVEAHEAQAAAARAAAKTAAAVAAAEAEADARVAAAAAEVRALRQRVALLEAQGEPSRRAALGGEAAAAAEVHVLRDLLAESLRLCRDALGPRPGGAAGDAAVATTRRQLEEIVAAGAGLLGDI